MRMVVCLVGVLAITSSSMAGLAFTENYDGQTVKEPPGAPWALDPHMADGGVWVETAGAQHSSPYSLLINNDGFAGRDFGSYALLDGGAEWNGSDACPLVLAYWLRHGSSRQQKEADFYVELSLGDVHAPPLPDDLDSQVPPDKPLHVLAYCKPWNSGDGNKKNLFYFDGKIWKKVGFTSGGWRNVVMAVNSASVDLQDGTGSGGHIAREYAGAFDRINIYTTNYVKGKWTSIDDVSVTDGYTTVVAALDVLPHDDPNIFVVNKKSKGRIPMAILGSDDLDVANIDADSISIAGAVFPVKTPSIEDVNEDGIDDLQIHFSRRDLIDELALDELDPGTEVEITVEATLLPCDALVATDVIILAAQGG